MLGEVGYRAYGESVGWRNYLNKPMPAWIDLPEGIRVAWDKAAYAIVAETTRTHNGPPPLDEGLGATVLE